ADNHCGMRQPPCGKGMTTSDHSVVIIRESEADDPLFQRWQGMSRERTAYQLARRSLSSGGASRRTRWRGMTPEEARAITRAVSPGRLTVLIPINVGKERNCRNSVPARLERGRRRTRQDQISSGKEPR